MKTNVFFVIALTFGVAFSGCHAAGLPFGAACNPANFGEDCNSGICNPSTNKCINCLSNSDCQQIEYCDILSNQCKVGTKQAGDTCTQTLECAGRGQLYCDPINRICSPTLKAGERCIADTPSLRILMCAPGFCTPYNRTNPVDGVCSAPRPFGESCDGLITCPLQYQCLVNDIRPTCSFILPTNGPECNNDLQCGAGDYCSTNFAGPGACKPRLTLTTDQCVRNRQCASNNCTNGFCTAAQTCNPNTGFNQCGSDKTCTAAGICLPPFAPGNPCTKPQDCAAPNVCAPATGLGPNTQLYCLQCSSATPPNGLGECDNPAISGTPAGVFCNAAEPIKTCTPKRGTGEACSTDYQCASFACDPATNKCLPLKIGDLCGSTKACPLGSFCPYGIFISPKTCTATLPIGAQCSADDNCYDTRQTTIPPNILCDVTHPIQAQCANKCNGVNDNAGNVIFPATYFCPAGYFCPAPTTVAFNQVRACRKPLPDTFNCTANSECLSGRCAFIDGSLGKCLPVGTLLPNGYACTTNSTCASGRCFFLTAQGPIGTCVAVPVQPVGFPCTTDAQCVTKFCSGGFCSAADYRRPNLGGGSVCTADVQCASGVCSYFTCGDWSCPTGVCTAVIPKLPLGAPCINSIDCASGLCRWVLGQTGGRCVNAPANGNPYPGSVAASPPPPPVQTAVPFYGKRNQLYNRAPGAKYLPVSPSPAYGKKRLLQSSNGSPDEVKEQQ